MHSMTTSDIEHIKSIAHAIAELRGQNEWFAATDKALQSRAVAMMPATLHSPDRALERGPRRIAVRSRPRGDRRKMRPGGYDRLAELSPELYSHVVTRKLPSPPGRSVTLSGKRWRAVSTAAAAAVPAVDVEQFDDPWAAAELIRDYRKFKRANESDIEAHRIEILDRVDDLDLGGSVFKGTEHSISIRVTGGGEGSRSCDFDELRALAPEVYEALVEVTEADEGEKIEYLDLRNIDRTSVTELRIDGAPDSAAASTTGAHPTIGEDFRPPWM